MIHQRKILTIDDEEAIRISFREFLEDYDYEIFEAENGKKGIEIFDKVKPDLVLVDLRMPEIDGLDVLEYVKKKSPNTPVIVISGTGIISDAIEAVRKGAWDYLLKPINDLSVLLYSIEKALEKMDLINLNIAYQEKLEDLVKKRTEELRATNKKLIEINDKLTQNEKNLSITLNSIGDGVIVVDNFLSIQRINPVAENLLNMHADNNLGHSIEHILNLYDYKTEKKIKNPVNQVLESGKQFKSEDNILLINNEGKHLIISLLISPIIDNTFKIYGAVLVIRDITEKVKMQEQLRQSEKMDAIGQLAGGVAHDFNNMLGGIMGAAEMLSILTTGNDKVQHFIDIIKDTSRRASDLTRKLLDFSRKDKQEHANFDFHDAIQKTVELLERSLDKKINIKLNLNATDTTINGDFSLVQNSLLNLGVNARDAMPNGGTLTFSTANITLDTLFCENSPFKLKPGDYIQVSVADTGTGMSKDVIKKIFEPFFTTKEVGKGTGLGLASVYRMLIEHLGAVNVYSELNEGSIFKLYFPLSSQKNNESQQNKFIVEKNEGTILVIDDEPIIRSTTYSMLNFLGFDVILAEDGIQGFELYKEFQDKISAVILDIVMPKENGKETFLKLQEYNPNIKVIISSGFNIDKDLEALINNETIHFLQKPFNRNDLIDILNKTLS